jgi:DnaJ family protein B protein 13
MVSVDEIICPETVRNIKGEGMPVFTRNSKVEGDALKFGDLYVKFNIEFPQQLTDCQKTRIDKLL